MEKEPMLDQGGWSERERSEHEISHSKRHSRSWLYLSTLFFLLSLVANIVFASNLKFVREIPHPPHGRSGRWISGHFRNQIMLKSRLATKIHLDTVWNRFYWNTDWSSSNHSSSDHLWEAIRPSHGIVALDRAYAEQNGLAEAMYLPSDHSKGVYLLEAYHQLHCLVCQFVGAIGMAGFTLTNT